jgi:hypothetical protein
MDSAKDQLDPWDYISITASDVDTSNTIDLSGLSNSAYTIGASGSVGSITGAYTYNNTSWSPTMAVSQSGQISLTGDDADIVINGVSLTEKLDAIAERLNILDVNKELEEEWDQLRAIGEQYRQLEEELKAKSAMWKTLKTKTLNKPRS